MRKYRSSKPYLKCRLKFDWHIESHEISEQFLNILAEFLVEKGFKRLEKITVRNREKQDIINFESCGPEGIKSGDISNWNNDMHDVKMNSEIIRKKCIVSSIFDADTIRPSSVATTLGLYATSLPNTKVYAISGLNITLSRTLNMPMVGTVGLMNIPATKELCDLAAHSFTSVSILNEQKSLLTAVTTELQTPSGKKKKKKR
ncbi:hypothetical protein DINM_004222 [Dirofilaria immitis]|nr:hypothetical protein [Dirofilaria immitis]